uniref:Uncharacterized protein n=1 Tax=Anas platyrhynchos platyrhynchos TaxID=8840 RepID=A0A493U1D4_ANAPP
MLGCPPPGGPRSEQLLAPTEDFEVLEEDEDDLSELPPLEDVGRARAPPPPEPPEDSRCPEQDPGETPEPPQEWLDVLGKQQEGGRHRESSARRRARAFCPSPPGPKTPPVWFLLPGQGTACSRRRRWCRAGGRRAAPARARR